MWHISCATYAHMPAGVRAGDVHSNFDKRDGETGALARRLPVVPGRPCPSRPSRRRVRRARRACRHRRPRRARRPRPAHGDPHSSREPPGPTDVAISAGTPRTPSSSGTHRQNAPMTVIVTSPCLLELQCIHRPTLPICRYVTCHEVILTDDQPCPR